MKISKAPWKYAENTILSALGAGRLMRNLLVGVGATDVRILAGAAVAMLAVTGLASWLPARRAARVDPLDVLRQE